jgi:hypothetical protein
MPQLVLRSGALTIDQHQQPSCCSKVRPVSDECQGLNRRDERPQRQRRFCGLS